MYGLNAVTTERTYDSEGNEYRFMELGSPQDKKYIPTTFNWSKFYQMHTLTIGANSTLLNKHKDLIILCFILFSPN
jgi:hypothetical protein